MGICPGYPKEKHGGDQEIAMTTTGKIGVAALGGFLLIVFIFVAPDVVMLLFMLLLFGALFAVIAIIARGIYELAKLAFTPPPTSHVPPTPRSPVPSEDRTEKLHDWYREQLRLIESLPLPDEEKEDARRSLSRKLLRKAEGLMG